MVVALWVLLRIFFFLRVMGNPLKVFFFFLCLVVLFFVVVCLFVFLDVDESRQGNMKRLEMVQGAVIKPVRKLLHWPR